MHFNELRRVSVGLLVIRLAKRTRGKPPPSRANPCRQAGVRVALLVCVATPLCCGCSPASRKTDRGKRLGSASGYEVGGGGGITIMVAPGILARVAARSAAASAGMPAADIATGTAEGNAALGATGVAGGVAAGAAAGAGLFGATTVAAGNLFAAGVAAPLAAGAPRKARPAMELPTKLANAIPV
jgi:hypothetical protein